MDRDGHLFVDKKRLLARAHRVEGQASAVARMIDQDDSCEDILQQIVALRAASQELAVLVVEDHVIARCAGDAIDGDRLAEELRSLLQRLARR